jgi:hypothetical protein
VAYNESTNCTVTTELWNYVHFYRRQNANGKSKQKKKKTGRVDEENNNCKYRPINRDITYRT